MDSRPRIRDTSGQDTRLAEPSHGGARRRRWLIGAGAGALLVALAAWITTKAAEAVSKPQPGQITPESRLAKRVWLE